MEFKRVILAFFIVQTSICLNVYGVPVVIGHRGASGYRPENTLESYGKAIEMGADYIEADLVSTKDHVLVASHNPDITETTDIELREEFASRKTSKNISGEAYTGFFVDDFTVHELQSLRTRERFEFRNHSFDDMFPMPTLHEILSYVKAKEKELKRTIGIYLETKHPEYYRSIGLPLEEKLIEELHQFGYTERTDPIFIESFETNLIQLSKMTNVSLIQLMSGTEGDAVQHDTGRKWSDIATPEGLKEISTYAQGVGAHKTCVYKKVGDERKLTDFVEVAHNLGLLVHVWSFRKEKEHFEKNDTLLFDTVEEEIRIFLKANVDGFFTDQPDIGVKIKKEMFPDPLPEYYLVILVAILFVAGIYRLYGLVTAEIKQPKKIQMKHNESKVDHSNVSMISNGKDKKKL